MGTTLQKCHVMKHGNRHRSYKIHFKFLPYKAYKTHFYLNPNRVLQYMEKVFLKKLVVATRKKLLVMSDFRLLSTATRREKGSKTAVDEDSQGNSMAPEPDGGEGESSDEGEGDGDTTSTKFRRRHDQDLEYEEPEEEEMMKEEESDNEDFEGEELTVKQEEDEEDDSQEALVEEMVSKKIKQEREILDTVKAKRVN
ncbi:death domain-associated protein 6-like, partial [Limulus polyphemus]|uniref:Death domain-associated protein 6-like n=1 Tax=Limulus polyphemus TaxID=6850 RepID=A0ABM1RYP5_LIMPO